MKTHTAKISGTHSFIHIFCRNSNSISSAKTEFAHTSAGIPSAPVAFPASSLFFHWAHCVFACLVICASGYVQSGSASNSTLAFSSSVVENFCCNVFGQLVVNASAFSIRENVWYIFCQTKCFWQYSGLSFWRIFLDPHLSLPGCLYEYSRHLLFLTPQLALLVWVPLYLIFHLALDTDTLLLALYWNLWIRGRSADLLLRMSFWNNLCWRMSVCSMRSVHWVTQAR